MTRTAAKLTRHRLEALEQQSFSFEVLKLNHREYIPINIEITGKDLIVGAILPLIHHY